MSCGKVVAEIVNDDGEPRIAGAWGGLCRGGVSAGGLTPGFRWMRGLGLRTTAG